jgi:hypothetical protein
MAGIVAPEASLREGTWEGSTAKESWFMDGRHWDYFKYSASMRNFGHQTIAASDLMMDILDF